MSEGYQDFYVPMALMFVSSEIEVPVNIKGSEVIIEVKITGSTVTLDVNITNPSINVVITDSTVTLDVNIKSSVTLNVNITGVDSGVTFNVQITGSSVTLNVNIESVGSDVVFNVNIKSQSVTLNVNISSVDSGVTFNVNIQSQSITLDINIKSQSVDIKVVNATDAAGNPIPLKIEITGSTITLDVNIASQSADLNVKITGQTVTLNVSVQGTANVNIAQAEVYLNVKQDEVFPPEIVTEDSTPSSYVSLSANKRYGFFVKNVRCFIAAMWIWFRNNSGSDIAVTIKIKLEPDGPTLREGTKTIPNGTDGFVQIIGSNGIWAGFWNNYDVLFFEIIPESDGLEVGTGTAKFHYYTGSYWTGYYTVALKINRWGIGEGIIPVSGTVNTIQIPNTAADTGKITFSLGANESKTFTIVEGTGRLLQLRLFATHQYVSVVIYCDGEAAFYTMPDIGACVFAYGHESDVPYFVAKRVWTISEGWGYIIFINLPLSFRRKLEVKVTNNVSNSVSGHFHVTYEVIK